MVEVVDSAAHFPGTCVITRSGSGPFIDTQRENLLGERQYVSVQLVQDMGALLGMASAAEVAGLNRRIAELEEELHAAAEIEQELEDLRDSVRYTLAAGAVEVDSESGVVTKRKLRPMRGRPAVSVE